MYRNKKLRILIIAFTLIAGVCVAGAQQSERKMGFPNPSASFRGSAFPSGLQRGPAFPTAPVLRARPLAPPASTKGLQAPPIPAVDNTVPLPTGALADCPKWDWSSGAPSPMRPPFDKSKLYCPPPPFTPRSPPIDCICRQ